MSAASDQRTGYRERIRLARERVEAAASAENEGSPSRQTAGARANRDPPSPARTMPGRGAEPSQMMQGTSLPPQQNQLSLGPSPIQSPVQEQTMPGKSPPRPYRPELHSWFATDSTSSFEGSHQSVQTLSPRKQITSQAQTESIYSQPETQDDSATAGPSRSSLASYHPSQHSSLSSIGDIPDFPVPQNEQLYEPPSRPQPQIHLQPQVPAPNHSRRAQNQGPPPSASARRGTSSPYAHQSLVSPIPEESPQSTPRRDRFSIVAASDISLDPVDEGVEKNFLQELSEESGRDTQSPHADVAILSPSHVRQASIGRKATPTLTLVRSGSGTARKGVSPQSISEAPTPTTIRHMSQAGSSGSASGFVPSPPEPSPPNAPTHEATAVSSEHGEPAGHVQSPRSISPLTPVVERIIGELERGGALPEGVSAPQIHEADAVEAHSPSPHATQKDDRISTTSLADLIRRATKVRTNLDRGRTASRLGMLDMFNRSKDKLAYYEKPDRGSMTDSMSGMIGWMPPRATAGMGMMQDTDKALEEGGSSRRKAKDKIRSDRRGRCCGMPSWLFFTVVVLLIACVAAAIIVPVELLVVPHQNDGVGATVTNCQASHACHNGGSPVVFTNACTCACVNGFTGKNCDITPPMDGSCAQSVQPVKDIPGSITMGFAIPRLIDGAAKNFSINLNATQIVGAFSQNDLSCSAENTLVTLGNTSDKRAAEMKRDVNVPLPTPAPMAPLNPGGHLRFRRGDAATGEVTSASLVLAASGSETVTLIPTSTANSTASASSASATSATLSIPRERDFARVAILFILQQSGNFTASELARTKLNTIFTMPIFQAQTVSFDGIVVDLTRFMVSVAGVSQGGASR